MNQLLFQVLIILGMAGICLILELILQYMAVL